MKRYLLCGNAVPMRSRPTTPLTLDSLHRTYCMHMYGCELWDLNRNYFKDFKVIWRKIKRRVWKLPYDTQRNCT